MGGRTASPRPHQPGQPVPGAKGSVSLLRELHTRKGQDALALRAKAGQAGTLALAARALIGPLRAQLLADLQQRLEAGQLHKAWQLAVADARENVEVDDVEAGALSTILISFVTSSVVPRLSAYVDECDAEQRRIVGELTATSKFMDELEVLLARQEPADCDTVEGT